MAKGKSFSEMRVVEDNFIADMRSNVPNAIYGKHRCYIDSLDKLQEWTSVPEHSRDWYNKHYRMVTVNITPRL